MIANATNQQYQFFKRKQSQLLEIMERLLPVAISLEMTARHALLQKLAERVQAENFKVLVIGEFKRGKSTFINALLGDEILPAYAKPCTAIINEVKWGDSPRALLYHDHTNENASRPPLEISVDDIEQYVVIQDDTDERSAIHDNPYEKVELFWPLELCQNGVEIIDSPGLNEHDIRQKVTTDYLSTVDAILFVLSCEVLGSKSEVDVIQNIRDMGHEDIFFICNRFNMIRPREREEIRQHGINKLSSFTQKGAERIFFVNALGALDGRLEDDIDAVERSGISQLERELEEFLATDRGRVKLLRPATDLKNTIYEARRVIPERQSMLTTDLKTLESRVQEAEAPLQRLEIQRRQIVAQLSNFRADMKVLVGDRGRTFYRRMADEVKTCAKDYEVKSPIKFFSLKGLKPQLEKVAEEIVEYLSEKAEQEAKNWQKTELQPLIEERLQTKKRELDEKASDFLQQVDSLRLNVAGISSNSLAESLSEEDIGRRKISPLERVLSAAAGFMIGDFGSAGVGSVLGYESLLPQLGLAIATFWIVGAFNPWIFIPVMFGGGVVQGLLTENVTNKKVKEAISKKFASELQLKSYERSSQLADAVDKELLKVEQAINDGLGQEIQNIREQVNSVVAEKQKGQANVDEKLNQLETLRQSLNNVDSELDDLITQIAML